MNKIIPALQCIDGQFPKIWQPSPPRKMQQKCLHVVSSSEGRPSVPCKWLIHVTSRGLIAAKALPLDTTLTIQLSFACAWPSKKDASKSGNLDKPSEKEINRGAKGDTPPLSLGLYFYATLLYDFYATLLYEPLCKWKNSISIFFSDVGSLKVHDECEEFGDDLDEYDVEEFEAGDDHLS